MLSRTVTVLAAVAYTALFASSTKVDELMLIVAPTACMLLPRTAALLKLKFELSLQRPPI
jgi:hypothetical protein